MGSFLAPLIAALGGGASVAAAGATIAGSLINKKSTEKANAANSPAGQVAQYEAAGLNPVPFMTSGSYVPQQASSAIGDGFANAGAILKQGIDLKHEQELQQTAVEQENEALREALADLQNPAPRSNMATYGVDIPSAQADGMAVGDMSIGSETSYVNDRFGSFSGRPQSRPTAADAGKTRVFLPDGQPRFIPTPIAERLNISPNTVMMAGEYTEIVGEARGEVETLLVADAIGETMGVPLFGNDNPLNSPEAPKYEDPQVNEFGLPTFGLPMVSPFEAGPFSSPMGY